MDMLTINRRRRRRRWRQPRLGYTDTDGGLLAAGRRYRCWWPIWTMVLLQQMAIGNEAAHENLCLEDDYTNDLPIFIEKRTICNYETVPVLVYTVKITPDAPGHKFCLKGENAERFNITKDHEVKLFERLSQPETNLRLQIIRTANDIAGTPGERRQAINAVQFSLIIEDCNQVSWQTIVVAVLSSACIVLMSSLAIMLILYQQKGLIKGSSEEERAEEQVRITGGDLRDESFINPRRTSSYEFSSLSRHSASTIERQETTENL